MHPLHPLMALRLARERAASHVEEARSARGRGPAADLPGVRRGSPGPALPAQTADDGRVL
jgi:hypothetical protein